MNTLILDSLALFLAASLHEDVAIVTAGFFVLEHDLPPAWALAAVYIGAVANNYVIYALGMAARRVPGLGRWLINDNVERVRQRLKRHLAWTMVLCRFVPGSLSPVVLGCGWLGVPFARFAVTSAVTAAVYVSLLTALVFTLGKPALHYLREHSWLVALAVAALATFIVATRLGKQPLRDGAR